MATTIQNYEVLFGAEHLDRLRTSISLAFDSETTQLQPERGKLRLLQIGSRSAKCVVVIDLFKASVEDWKNIIQFFHSVERFWLAHNASFDLAWLQEHGIHPKGVVHCSMLASRLLTNGISHAKHGLAQLAKRYLEREIDKEQQKSNWGAPELSEEQLVYAAEDVVTLLDLDPVITRLMTEGNLMTAFLIECRALPAMAQLWRTGLPWDREALETARDDYTFDIAELGKQFLAELDVALPADKKLPRDPDGSFNLRPRDTGAVRLGTKQYAGFNINSPKQLCERLGDVLGEQPLDPKTGKPSASRASLRGYAADHEVIQTYLAWKRAEKRRQMCESILEKMDADGFVRASYMQMGADTGRMSCIKPNNQQIPRDPQFRDAVVAPEGWHIVDADFSGMELRLAAAISGDVAMTQAFQEGQDLHTLTAEALGCDRQVAKSANFGLLYGSGAKGLRDYAGAMGITMTMEQARQLRNTWLDTYSGIAAWHTELANAADQTADNSWAEIRVPHSKFRRYLQGDLNRLTVRANTPVQGSGAAILKTALALLWPQVQAAGEQIVRLAGVVHDEVILLVRDGYEQRWASILQHCMEKAESVWLGSIPAVAEAKVGRSWGDVH